MTQKTQTIIKWGVLTLLLVYSTLMTIWAHNEARKHVCTGISVNVEGPMATDSVTKSGVIEELRNYHPRIVGTPLHQLNTGAIEDYLTRLNTFESVNCMISSRGELVVRVVPLVPVMRVFFADNSYYINKDGKHIASNAEFFNDVPVVSGRFTRKFTPRDVLPLVNYIRKDEMLGDLVSMVVAEDAHNLLLIPRIRGQVINFGDTTRLDEKKKALRLFYTQVMPYKGWEEYDTISVKFRNQVVATRRDKTRLNHAEEYFEEVDPEEGTLPDADPGAATEQNAPAQENGNIGETPKQKKEQHV